jgi:hypothetical protein
MGCDVHKRQNKVVIYMIQKKKPKKVGIFWYVSKL